MYIYNSVYIYHIYTLYIIYYIYIYIYIKYIINIIYFIYIIYIILDDVPGQLFQTVAFTLRIYLHFWTTNCNYLLRGLNLMLKILIIF